MHSACGTSCPAVQPAFNNRKRSRSLAAEGLSCCFVGFAGGIRACDKACLRANTLARIWRGRFAEGMHSDIPDGTHVESGCAVKSNDCLELGTCNAIRFSHCPNMQLRFAQVTHGLQFAVHHACRLQHHEFGRSLCRAEGVGLARCRRRRQIRVQHTRQCSCHGVGLQALPFAR